MWISRQRYYELSGRLIKVERELARLEHVRIRYSTLEDSTEVPIRDVVCAIADKLGLRVVYSPSWPNFTFNKEDEKKGSDDDKA